MPYYRVTLIAVHPNAEVRQGVAIVPFKRFRNKILRVSVTWFIMFWKAIRAKANVYQVHDPELIPCALLLRLLGKRVILDLHENVAEDIFDKPWIQNKKLLFAFFRFFEKRAVNNLFLFLAEHSYAERYKKLGANFEVVLNYYDPHFFKQFVSPVKRDTFRIFYIGILLESRGLLEIAEALWILKQKGMRVDFDVVGELYSDLEKSLKAKYFYGDIADQLHFYGRLPLEQGYEISRKAAVGMCIIHPMKNSVGSYPTKMFEYMAIGLPQVISNFPLYQAVVETHECGICVDPKNPTDIALAIEKILKDRPLADRMAANGKQNAVHYTWQSQFEKALAVYRN